MEEKELLVWVPRMLAGAYRATVEQFPSLSRLSIYRREDYVFDITFAGDVEIYQVKNAAGEILATGSHDKAMSGIAAFLKERDMLSAGWEV